MSLKKIKGIVVEPQIRDTYLTILEACDGTPLFKTFYAKVNGKKMDITRGGSLGCAFFTSSILKLFNLIGEVQVTKNRVVKDLRESGWVDIKKPKKGCVVIWGPKPADSSRMKKDGAIYQSQVEHCGFYLGDGVALSTGGDKESLTPTRHPLNYRPITTYLWHPALEVGFKNPTRRSKHQPGVYWHPNK